MFNDLDLLDNDDDIPTLERLLTLPISLQQQQEFDDILRNLEEYQSLSSDNYNQPAAMNVTLPAVLPEQPVPPLPRQQQQPQQQQQPALPMNTAGPSTATTSRRALPQHFATAARKQPARSATVTARRGAITGGRERTGGGKKGFESSSSSGNTSSSSSSSSSASTSSTSSSVPLAQRLIERQQRRREQQQQQQRQQQQQQLQQRQQQRQKKSTQQQRTARAMPITKRKMLLTRQQQEQQQPTATALSTTAAINTNPIRQRFYRAVRSPGFTSYPELLMSRIPNLSFIRFVRSLLAESNRIRYTFTSEALLRLKYEAVSFLLYNMIRFFAVYENVKTTPSKCGKTKSIIIQPNHIHLWFAAIYNYYNENEAKKICAKKVPRVQQTTRRAASTNSTTAANCVLVNASTLHAKRDFNRVLCECINDYFRVKSRSTGQSLAPLPARISSAAMVEVNQVFVLVVERLLRQTQLYASSSGSVRTGVRVVESDVIMAAAFLFPECVAMRNRAIGVRSGGSSGGGSGNGRRS